MSTETVPTAQTTEWHPDWCGHGEHCTPNSPHGNIHTSNYRQLTARYNKNVEGGGGEEFIARLQAAAYSENPGEILNAESWLILENDEKGEAVEIYLSTQRLRALAAWMIDVSYAIDDVHSGERPSLAGDIPLIARKPQSSD